MDGYLLDTCIISALLDGRHTNYEAARRAIEAIPIGSPTYVSRITIAELAFGFSLHEAATGRPHPRASEILKRAQEYPILELTKHSATEYGELKKNLAVAYLPNLISSQRPRWIDQWPDRVTGENLQVDENDVWICAQGRERNLIVVTTDEKMVARISGADSEIRFRFVRSAQDDVAP